MHLPQIVPSSFEKGFIQAGRKPGLLLQTDSELFVHCHETAQRTPLPELAHQSMAIAHSILATECSARRIVVPRTTEDVLTRLLSEMVSLGNGWDVDMAKRLKADKRYAAFHAVFEDWSRKKPRPTLAFHGALRMFRIFELRVQHL